MSKVFTGEMDINMMQCLFNNKFVFLIAMINYFDCYNWLFAKANFPSPIYGNLGLNGHVHRPDLKKNVVGSYDFAKLSDNVN